MPVTVSLLRSPRPRSFQAGGKDEQWFGVFPGWECASARKVARPIAAGGVSVSPTRTSRPDNLASVGGLFHSSSGSRPNTVLSPGRPSAWPSARTNPNGLSGRHSHSTITTPPGRCPRYSARNHLCRRRRSVFCSALRHQHPSTTCPKGCIV